MGKVEAWRLVRSLFSQFKEQLRVGMVKNVKHAQILVFVTTEVIRLAGGYEGEEKQG